MRELLLEIPPPHRLYELTVGNENRVALIWQPARTQLISYLKILQDLVVLERTRQSDT